MTKFTRILAAVLVAVMGLVCFAACTNETPATTPATTTPATTTPATTAPATTTPATADPTNLPVLKMGTNAYFPPYEFYEGEKIVGIDAEIAEAIANKLGMKLEIVDMNFDSILSAVNAGTIDFGMAGMTITEDRLLEVDFSNSYAKGVQAIIVKEGSAIKTADDLSAEGATYKIGVQLGTTGDIYATGDFGDERVTQYQTGNEAVAALIKGDVDCVIIDNEPAKSYVNANEGIKTLETSYADEDYAICVKKGNSELLNKINTAIYELTKDGTIEGIVNKYIGE